MSNGITQVKNIQEMGLSGRALLNFIPKMERLGICTLAIVKDNKFFSMGVKPWNTENPHTLFSLSKSFCSMAAGMAVEEGLLSYSDIVADVLSDSLPEDYDPALHEVSLHHLLSMSSGLHEGSDQDPRKETDLARAILSYPVIYEPGTHFHYNTMGTYLIGRMVSKKTGLSLRDYLMPRLFEPLGIQKPQWDCCPMGYNLAGYGLHLSVTDLAKTAQLLLNRGVYQGRRLLSEDYLSRACVKQIDNYNPDQPDHADWTQGYGYQFWMARNGRFRGDGMYGQVMMIDPNAGLAVCCTAGLNAMGDEMDAIHALMDELTALPLADEKETAKLNERVLKLSERMPEDRNEPLFGEGSYDAGEGRGFRLEVLDENTLRVMFTMPDVSLPLCFTFGRKEAHRGEFTPFVLGEGPQPYLGWFGVKNGVIRAHALMYRSPYKVKLHISAQDEGLRLQVRAIGLDSGTYRLKKYE